MAIEAVVFDLDGTLLDTLQDIADAANQALREADLPTHEVDAYRHLVGEGVDRLFERAIQKSADHAENVARCVAAFGGIYHNRWDAASHPYEGIPELLAELTRRGIRMAVLSNKPDEFTQLCVRKFFPDVAFRPVMGQRVGHAAKPDPNGALEIARILEIAPSQFLYVGDTNVDMRTAVASGMVPIGVAWGFRSVEELKASGARTVIYRPGELIAQLSSKGAV